MNIAKFLRGLKRRDNRSIAKLISLAENNPKEFSRISSRIPRPKNPAIIIGITGSPGAGKSTLVDRLALEMIKSKKKVAVLAVDPSSPFSLGAVLGDRFRMQLAAEHNIYIRSFASRGELGGLSQAIPSAIQILESAGYQYIIIETVGVGQGEVEIARVADCSIVVMVPGMGDSIQAMKAGILEIADLFVINKADYDGVELLEKELLSMLEGANLKKHSILKTVATKSKGITELLKTINFFIKTQKHNNLFNLKRQSFIKYSLRNEVVREIFSNEKFNADLERISQLSLKSKKLAHKALQTLIKMHRF